MRQYATQICIFVKALKKLITMILGSCEIHIIRHLKPECHSGANISDTPKSTLYSLA